MLSWLSIEASDPVLNLDGSRTVGESIERGVPLMDVLGPEIRDMLLLVLL